MKVLHFDCFSGISGDMTVAALVDLGGSRARLATELRKLGLSDEYRLAFSRGLRRGVSGVRFDVKLSGARAHAHGSAPRRHAHGRSYTEIRKLIGKSRLSAFVKTRATNLFRRIAVAEGKIHGMPPERVHFHEVGAADSIVDLVGTCLLLEELAPDRITASTPCEGKGFVECAHGRFPVPTPATLEILKGVAIRQVDLESELITPTGAAILAEFVQEFGKMPEMAVRRIGYGLGLRDHASQPNALRAVLGEGVASARAGGDEVVVLEANVDDVTPEVLASAGERLLAAGARDAFLTPVLMKKGRPGTLVTALADPGCAAEIAEAIFRETGTFGVRMRLAERFCLDRKMRGARTPWGKVAVKVGSHKGRVVAAKPEFSDCERLARATGRPAREVWTAAAAECAKILLSGPKRRR
ncbi:MAG: nickel pincer cofactor biosynthesis protein LarC [Verrucomicrobiae bacterium]|nr:nickel pincer cofactor biosynthesis protein LarC [Verrucomicrobiae bacterium]